MWTGKMMLTHFRLHAEKLKVGNADGVELDVYGLTALMLNAGNDEAQAELTIPMDAAGVISTCTQLAALLTPAERAELMAKLAVHGVMLARPGDERRVADALKPESQR